jgi:hypothetical protein
MRALPERAAIGHVARDKKALVCVCVFVLEKKKEKKKPRQLLQVNQSDQVELLTRFLYAARTGPITTANLGTR